MSLLLCPWWFLMGCFMAVATPFIRLWEALKDIVAVCDAEWKNRWTASEPKMPNGDPYKDIENRNLRDYAVVMGVLLDYDKEHPIA